MISNYFHDLAVALLVTNILVLFFAGRLLEDNPAGRELVKDLFYKLTRVSWVALAYVILGGALRAWFFMDFEWNPMVGKGQVAALVVKHAILVTLTIAGIGLHLKYYKKYGR
jgi:protein-S-isoprenylcysteine O-methyltransferase Ste14